MCYCVQVSRCLCGMILLARNILCSTHLASSASKPKLSALSTPSRLGVHDAAQCLHVSATCVQAVCGTVDRALHSSLAGEVVYTAHCGDSRAVLCKAGRAVRLTEDHKPNLPAERERIRRVGGRIDFSNCWRVIVQPTWDRPGSGLAVSRSFGDLAFKQPCRFPTLHPLTASSKLP